MTRIVLITVCTVSRLIVAQEVRGQTPQTNVREESADHVPSGRALVPFLEGTDVFLTSLHDTKFEANIAPHLIVKQTFGDVLNLTEQLKRIPGGGGEKQLK